MASSASETAVQVAGDKYRSFLDDEDHVHKIQWRHGGPPIFDSVNKLFEEGRTKVISYLLCALSLPIPIPTTPLI